MNEEGTLVHSPAFHSMGQSIMLQYCWNLGAGCGQSSAATGRVLLPPRATSWMQCTSRLWMPPPHVLLHGEKSLMFQRGGHGTSLHVRVIESGRRSSGHSAGLTTWSLASSTHSVMDSCTPASIQLPFHFYFISFKFKNYNFISISFHLHLKITISFLFHFIYI